MGGDFTFQGPDDSLPACANPAFERTHGVQLAQSGERRAQDIGTVRLGNKSDGTSILLGTFFGLAPEQECVCQIKHAPVVARLVHGLEGAEVVSLFHQGIQVPGRLDLAGAA